MFGHVILRAHFGPRQTHKYISREISIEHPSVGLASLAQLDTNFSAIGPFGFSFSVWTKIRPCCRAVASGPAGPVLAGPLFL